jgi:hypothetical protein
LTFDILLVILINTINSPGQRIHRIFPIENGMKHDYLVSFSKNKLPKDIGDKAVNLYRLKNKGFRIPDTIICLSEAFFHYQQEPDTTFEILRKELIDLINPYDCYAVRSSANIEDGIKHSFAGQFRSILDVKGIDPILNAVKEIWDSAETSNIYAYLANKNISNEPLKMGVIIQKMVHPLFSGVVFSCNPITGSDEILVEAVPGSGEKLVQSGITPFQWVNKSGAWLQQPVQETISTSVIQEVVDQTISIRKTFKQEIDLEWVYDGRSIYWVQMRLITSLESIPIYSNAISREVLPGMIKPLIWSINNPLVNSAWLDLISEVIGPNEYQAVQLSKSFYYRTYFNIGFFEKIFERLGIPSGALEHVMGVYPGERFTPRFRFTARTIRLLPLILVFL